MAGHAAGHRVNGEAHFHAALAKRFGEIAHLMLRLCHGHAVAGNDDDLLRVGQQERGFIALDGFDGPAREIRITGGTGTGASPERAEQDIFNWSIHSPAHVQREQRAGGAHQRAGDDHRQIVEGEPIRRDREAGE